MRTFDQLTKLILEKQQNDNSIESNPFSQVEFLIKQANEKTK